MGAVLVATSAAAWAQPRATARLSPVEGAAWSVTAAAPVDGRVCLEAGGYVAAVRVEPGFLGAFGMDRDGEVGPGGVAAIVVGENDGRRETWDLFRVEGGRAQCFQVRAVARGALTEAQLRRVALRAQIFLLRVGAFGW